MDKNTQQPVAWLKYPRKKPELRKVSLSERLPVALKNSGWVSVPLYKQPTAQAMPRDVLIDALLEMLDAIVVQTRALTGFAAVIDGATIRDIADKYSVMSSEFEDNDSSDGSCKFPLCQNEQYQQDMAEALHRELYAGQPEPVNQQMLSALEPFALMSKEGVVAQATGHVTVTTCAEYFHRAAIAAAEAAQPVEVEQLKLAENNWPDKCPITRREFFMEIDGVPTYGGPFDSYTIPEMTGEANQPFHERELFVRRYDHDRGGWVEDEFIPLRVIHEDVLIGLEDSAYQPSSAQPVAVPEEITVSMAPHSQYAKGWNACRRAMLSAAQKQEGVCK